MVCDNTRKDGYWQFENKFRSTRLIQSLPTSGFVCVSEEHKESSCFFYICQCWIPVRCRDPRMCVGTNTPYSIYTRVRLKPEFWEIHQNLVATLLVSNFPSPLLPTQYNSLWEVLKESFRKTLKLSGTPAQFRIYSHEGLLSKNLINLLLTLVL